MFYSFELVMAGVILFSAMIGGGIYMYFKKKSNQSGQSAIPSENPNDAANG